jgi:plasmid stability protein
MGYLTVREVPGDLVKALKKETQRRGKSLNQTVIDLLEQALGLGWESPGKNGLEKLAGSWSRDDLERFEQATAIFETIDEEQWR